MNFLLLIAGGAGEKHWHLNLFIRDQDFTPAFRGTTVKAQKYRKALEIIGGDIINDLGHEAIFFCNNFIPL